MNDKSLLTEEKDMSPFSGRVSELTARHLIEETPKSSKTEWASTLPTHRPMMQEEEER